MYLYKIKIKNFRNIKDLDWKPNKDFNILFGSNGSGKSNIASAINLLFNGNYNDDIFDFCDFYECNTDNKIEIECWLNEVNSINSVISEYIQHIDKKDKIVEDDTDEELKTVLIISLTSEGLQKKWSIVQSTGISTLPSSIRKEFRYDYLNSDRVPEKDINLITFPSLTKNISSKLKYSNKLAE